MGTKTDGVNSMYELQRRANFAEDDEQVMNPVWSVLVAPLCVLCGSWCCGFVHICYIYYVYMSVSQKKKMAKMADL